METGKRAHQSCWDGKRSGEPGVWEESNTAWVVYRLARRRLRILSINTSKANTRREQSISADRKIFVKKNKKYPNYDKLTVNKLNLEIERSGANDTGLRRKRPAGTVSLNTTVGPWSSETMIRPSRRSSALSTGLWLQRLTGSPTAHFQAEVLHRSGGHHAWLCLLCTRFGILKAKLWGNRAGEQTPGVKKM